MLDVDGPSLGLVLGPPGSGKTTLLSRVAAAAGGRSAWYRAGPEDDDEPALVRHLGQALSMAVAEPGLAELAEAGSVDALVVALESIENLSGHLVVDDLHEIAGSRAERALERFVSLRPRGVRILLGSRRPPALNTSRLLVSGELYQFDAEDLRFRSWEVEELFRVVYDRPLSPEAAAALTRRTGGWAAGLQLFHLATQAMSRSERERAVEELSGRSRLIRSYLARNVLEGLPVERRRFLLRTCTLSVLTGELCDELLGTTGSALVLDELERLQFFTTSMDGGVTYRYTRCCRRIWRSCWPMSWAERRPGPCTPGAPSCSSRPGALQPPYAPTRGLRTGVPSAGCSSTRCPPCPPRTTDCGPR